MKGMTDFRFAAVPPPRRNAGFWGSWGLGALSQVPLVVLDSNTTGRFSELDLLTEWLRWDVLGLACISGLFLVGPSSCLLTFLPLPTEAVSEEPLFLSAVTHPCLSLTEEDGFVLPGDLLLFRGPPAALNFDMEDDFLSGLWWSCFILLFISIRGVNLSKDRADFFFYFSFSCVPDFLPCCPCFQSSPFSGTTSCLLWLISHCHNVMYNSPAGYML